MDDQISQQEKQQTMACSGCQGRDPGKVPARGTVHIGSGLAVEFSIGAPFAQNAHEAPMAALGPSAPRNRPRYQCRLQQKRAPKGPFLAQLR
jgi:hypothetical protein